MRYRILTSRRRATVALVHSIAFCGLAAYGLDSMVAPLHSTSPASAWMMASVYVVVTSVLLVLTQASGHVIEQLYFGLCTASAALGLVRQMLGDPEMHFAVYGRVLLLSGAVVAGMWIVRAYAAASLPVEERLQRNHIAAHQSQ